MAKKYLPPKQQVDTERKSSHSLPVDKPIAVYYRQSSMSQVGNISTNMQQIDLPRHVVGLGWTEDCIILIDEDEGISGATKIDERAGMRRLYNLIITDQIAAVAVQAEDRLFRDETQIQVNVFIDACLKHQVRVITPYFKYNFSDKLEGSYHKLLFRMRAEQAAEYLNTYVRGRLVAAKQKMLLQGMWMGGNIALGFMVDDRKNLPSGIPNPLWRKYVPFEPCASIVREIFKVFVNLGGNANGTLKYLHNEGLYFPDFDSAEFQAQVPNGFKCEKPLKMVKKKGHYIPGRVALINMLTNGIYLGHWAYRNRIAVWDNHEPIIDEDLFYQAFNYLSPVLLDGSENPNYKPRVAREHRKVRKQRKPRNAIYQGLVGSYHEGNWRTATVSWNKHIEDYVYSCNYMKPDTTGAYLWSRHVRYFDPIITEMLHAKIHATFDKDVWEETLSNADDNFEADEKQLTHQLNSVVKKMRTIADNFSIVTIPTLLEDLQNDYKNHEIEKRRIEEKLKSVEKAIAERETLKELAQHAERVLVEWDSYGLAERQTVANAFIERIVVTPHEDSRAADTTIIWKDGSEHDFVLPYRSDSWVLWIPEEVEILAKLIKQEASQVEIASALPDRNWRAIRIKAYEIIGSRNFQISPKPIRDPETYDDYLERVRTQGKEARNIYGNRWTEDEIELLEDGLDNGATQLELVAALPVRTWKAIQKKIRQLRGAGFKVQGNRPVGNQERIEDYLERNPEEAASMGLMNITNSSPRRMTRTPLPQPQTSVRVNRALLQE